MTKPLVRRQGLAIVLSVLLSPGISAQDGERPNVLLIIVDDLRPLVGAYGDNLAQTPHIDELAASGVVFENAFASVPICGASRASFLSGRKPTTNRFLNFSSRLDRDLPGVPSLPGWFRDHGYYTLASGKIFDSMLDSPESWSEPLWSPEGEWTSAIEPDERGEHIQRAYLDNPDGVLGPAFERLDVEDSDYPDGKIADKTVEDLRRMSDRGEPFFLAVGFRKPHLPFNAPARYWDLYDPADFKLPTTYYELAVGAPPHVVHTSFELRGQYTGIPPEGLLEESQALNLIHAYRAAVSYADALVGKVLGGLEDNGLDDNTIVMLIGDHGWNLGEQTMWTKMNLFDIALHTPMIIRDPSRGSGRAGAITDFLDIFPTLIELTGLPAPDELDGVSLVPVLEDTTRTVKPASFSRWFDGESVRTERYRYTEWRSEEGEITDRMLFDLLNDSEETRSVADEAEYESVVRELSALITADESFVEWSPIVRRTVARRTQ